MQMIKNLDEQSASVRLSDLPETAISTILSGVSEGLSIHGTDGRVRWVNQRLCDVLEKTPDELRSLSCQDLFHPNGELCSHVNRLNYEHPDASIELRTNSRHLLVQSHVLLDQAKVPIGFIQVVMEIPSSESQEQLIAYERLVTLGMLLSGVAHDVGTPLNVISGYAEFLLMKKSSTDPGFKELSAILEQTRRISATFGRALDFGRPPKSERHALDLKQVVLEALDLVSHHLRKLDVKVEITCEIAAPLIYGEAPQLRQVVFILCLNAGQVIGIGGKLRVVVSEASDRPGFLALTLVGILSSGKGHDFSHTFAILFNPQVTNDKFGSGLYLAKTILDQAKAQIRMRESGDLGAGIVVYFPTSVESFSAS